MNYFGVDTTEAKQLEAELDRLNKYGIKNAVRNTVTTAAQETAEHAKRNLGRHFTIRNKYTERSISFERANQRDIEDMEAVAGSVQAYMKKQDEGFTERSMGSHGLAIPAPGASGEGGKRRHKSVMRKNYMQSLKPVKAYGYINHPVQKGGNKSNSGVAIAAKIAIQEGSRVLFIDSRRDHWHRKTGFYRVLGSSKAIVRRDKGWPVGARLELIYTVNRKSTTTKKHDWLLPGAKIVAGKMDYFYMLELDKEMRKSRLRRR